MNIFLICFEYFLKYVNISKIHGFFLNFITFSKSANIFKILEHFFELVNIFKIHEQFSSSWLKFMNNFQNSWTFFEISENVKSMNMFLKFMNIF